MATTHMVTVTFRAMSVKDISTKIEAFRSLFGETPTLRISGTVEDTRGSTAFLTSGSSALVTDVGRRYLTVECEGTWLLDVGKNASEARYTLSARLPVGAVMTEA